MSNDPHLDLERLRTDVEQLDLATGDEVRRRGDQRTRRTRAALATGAAAVAVLAAVGVAIAAQENSSGRVPPGGSSTSASEPASSTSPSRDAEADRELAHAALLTADMLPGPSTGAWLEIQPQQDAPIDLCLRFGVDDQFVAERWFGVSEPDPVTREMAQQKTWVLPDEATAEYAYLHAVELLMTCLSGGLTEQDPVTGPAHGGDEAYVVYGGVDVGVQEAMSIQEAVVVRVGRAVTIVDFGVIGNGDLPYVEDVAGSFPAVVGDSLAAFSAS